VYFVTEAGDCGLLYLPDMNLCTFYLSTLLKDSMYELKMVWKKHSEYSVFRFTS